MYEYKAEILKWVDWDTVIVRIDVWFEMDSRQRIRLARIDAPALNDTSTYKKRQAKSATYHMNKICPVWSEVILQTKKNPVKDMYARYIAEIIYKWKNLSDFALALKWVKRFD